jgi:GNAT superfamily N-acetyltransferase
MDLPPELTSRPLRPTDSAAVHELVALAEAHDAGEAAVELEDILSDWQRASFDLATESVGVFDGDRLVATGEVFKGRRIESAVHPDERGRGIGSWLLIHLEGIARERGSSLVGQTVAADSDAERFFRERGYREGWTSWVLRLPEESEIPTEPLPDGYVVRDAVPGEEDEVAYRLVEDAFNEWPGRDPATFEDWAARVVDRPGFERWQLRLAVDPDGIPVGVSFTIVSGRIGYVGQIAVRRDRRGLGLGRALLVDAFTNAREHGATVSELSTDSRTGALGLYEHVGMKVTQTWRHWMTDL